MLYPTDEEAGYPEPPVCPSATRGAIPSTAPMTVRS
uniref:Uncharacterized protein n=1 Tax=Caudovirales sp. ctTVN2 TaxID=2827634 RepID=A0A8S5S959_9CAUD|nr:MAG TPA: hypothetical protein [Caudovirales sp. ctTVN2]